MADITLSSAVRSNLNALQATSALMSSVQEKLATGKKVHSALDNPNSFFTAKGLENRASDLSTLLDDMGQSVQTLQAADEGIGAISDLVDAAKAKANQAQQTSSQTERAQFAREYNELLTQIEDLAKDAGYKGKNLLGGTGNALSVTFTEDGIAALAKVAAEVNDTIENIGARRLYTVMERVFEELRFTCLTWQPPQPARRHLQLPVRRRLRWIPRQTSRLVTRSRSPMRTAQKSRPWKSRPRLRSRIWKPFMMALTAQVLRSAPTRSLLRPSSG